jgi:PQQ-dependent dehydrogenase (methanol/ethanol family)
MSRFLVRLILLSLFSAAEMWAQAGPTQAELTAAQSSRDWLYATHDYSGQRYADLKQITPSNARTLRVACVYQASDLGPFQPHPIVYRGVMYLTTRYATMAIDAATCRQRWSHALTSPTEQPTSFGDAIRALFANRGTALKDGKLVRGTPDGRLLALDAASGAVVWERTIADSAIAEVLTMPPLIFEDLVVIGPAVSEGGVRGWVGAFRLTNGKPVWKFYTVPAPGEPGSETWENPEAFKHGGGAVWTPFSFDPAEGLLFVAAGNPAPDLAPDARPGDNLYTNSMIALDIRTGALRWHRQFVPNDYHDWDLTHAGPLLTTSVGGTWKELIVAAGKDGLLRTVDRNSREVLTEVPVTTRSGVEAPITKEGVHACPGFLGGVEWNGPAYNPRTGLLYVPAVDWCATFKSVDSVEYKPGTGYFGGEPTLDSTTTGTGWLTAVDAATGKARWRYKSDSPMLAAVTTTSGGVLFTGETAGDFLVLDAKNGRVLHRLYTGGPLAGGVVTYEVRGKQYVAAASGSLAGFWKRPPGSATMFVFALP